MKKLFLLVLVAALLSGCTNPLNKTIKEILTAQELAKVENKNPGFSNIYSLIQNIKDSLMRDSVSGKNCGEITYRRVNDFVLYINDTSVFNHISDSLKVAWEKQYGLYSNKADSILSYWNKYKEERDVNQYVRIDLAEIDKEYYPYSGKLNTISLGIRVVPLKGAIDYVKFSYKIIPRSAVNKAQSIYDIYNSPMYEPSWCTLSSRFSGAVLNYWEVNYTNKKILEGRNMQTFNSDFVIYFEITELRKDGRTITKGNAEIPASVLSYWENGGDEDKMAAGMNGIIKEILGVDYVPEELFLSEAINVLYAEKDKDLYDLLVAGGWITDFRSKR
ncbi:MAG: hypothetical protein M0R37_06835 [Bacteroidales bacterium]|nr:hypothetical protein [Bacteroidales bacterium]